MPANQNPETETARPSDRELVVTRRFAAPVHLVYAAWTQPALLTQWWAPQSFGIRFVSCETDPRTGGAYRFVFTHPDFPEPMAFFGTYLEATPPTRLVWTNEESGDAGAITTVTFAEQNGHTLVTLHDLYPSKEALEACIASGATSGTCETLEQLDALLPSLAPA